MGSLAWYGVSEPQIPQKHPKKAQSHLACDLSAGSAVLKHYTMPENQYLCEICAKKT
jgi:hypothetical protein